MNTPPDVQALEKNLSKLPEHCAAQHPLLKIPVLIKRGEQGYRLAPADLNVNDYNARMGITPQQRAAMLIGSMFGFHVPGANPDNQRHVTE